MKLFYGSNFFPQACFCACSLYSVTNCKYYFTGMITTMSYWMQILDLRWPKLIYWTVHVVLTHDLDECQKTLMRSQHWFRWWLGARQGDIHYLSKRWTSSMSLHGIIILQCGLVTPYREIEFCRHWLAQVIVCCLTTPIHSLNWCWLICLFFCLFLFVSLLSHFWLIHLFYLHLLYQPYVGLCQATRVQSHQRQSKIVISNFNNSSSHNWCHTVIYR